MAGRRFLSTAAVLWLGAWGIAGVSAVHAAETKSVTANSNGIDKRDRVQDWEILCGKQKRADGSMQSVCTLAQAVNEKESKKIFMTAEIAVDASNEQGLLLNIAPVGIDFMQGVKLVLGDKSFPLQLRTCYPQGCIATTAIEAVGGVKAMATATSMSVQFNSISGESFKVPLSSKGLSEAADKMSQIIGK